MRKQIVRLTESDLHRIIKESVKKILKEATAGGAGGASGGLINFSSGIGKGSGLAAGATTAINEPEGNGSTVVHGKGLTDKKKKKSSTDIINHGRDVYNATGDKGSSNVEDSSFLGPALKRGGGKNNSTSIPKHRV